MERDMIRFAIGASLRRAAAASIGDNAGLASLRRPAAASIALAAAMLAHAATPLFEAPFEKANAWSAVRGGASPDGLVQHDGKIALRLERAGDSPDACARSASIALTIGRRYELNGWVRTEGLTVHDSGVSPIASGAALTMASMPFDVHSASLGGTTPWTRLTLRFTASRASDQILLTAGQGGTLSGFAWFEGISLDEISSSEEWPAREAVHTFGPAYRYPAAGWIYLHIEGKPYERGYQHGYLMAREIPEYLERCAADLGVKAERRAWDQLRTSADALFLRGFDREILEEMRGIADGANAHGARWLGREIDLVDLVVANTEVEMSELRAAMAMTPTGLEGLHLQSPAYYDRKRDSTVDHCSAFAATGPATRDGKMVIGHMTWWSLTLAEQTNVMLDIQPAAGHRMLMQSYPGGIESGTDWYQNDAGVVLTETTIRQTPFNVQGTPVAFRARMAIQYGGDIDGVVKQLGTRNNGLYTNEWLIADAKNNEIAMYELGTNHVRLWRSSQNDWFGNTPGFYWGNNNAKDLAVKLEYLPDPQGAPEYEPYVPHVRDLAWLDLYRRHRGQIDEQFGFLAFRTPPLVSPGAMDAKISTADMASHLMLWAAIGKPDQRERLASGSGFAKNDGLYPSGYYLFRAAPSDALRVAIRENEKTRLAAAQAAGPEEDEARENEDRDRLWKGWILPASDADTWFVAGSASYRAVLESKDIEQALDAWRARYRRLRLSPDNAMNGFALERAKGVLYLDALRRKLGDDRFLALMRAFFAANTTKAVTARSFLDQAGLRFDFSPPAPGPIYLVEDIDDRLASAILVYGTVREAGANRYAAGELQRRYFSRSEIQVPIYKDFEVSEDLLRHHDVIFVGRPESNSALAAWSAPIGLDYAGAEFRIDGRPYADERAGLLLAAKNPLDEAHMVLVIAGNDALRTVKAAHSDAGEVEYAIFENGRLDRAGFRKPN
jgi:hypothetical protein